MTDSTHQISVPSHLTDREVLLLVRQNQDQLLSLVRQMSTSVVSIEQRLVQIEQRQALADQTVVALRQDMTMARLEAADARRTAQGVGKSLDDFKDSVDRDKARIAGQVSVIHWIGGIVGTVVVSILVAFLTGVLHL